MKNNLLIQKLEHVSEQGYYSRLRTYYRKIFKHCYVKIRDAAQHSTKIEEMLCALKV